MRSLRRMTPDLVSWASEACPSRAPRLQVLKRLIGIDLSPFPFLDQVSDASHGFDGGDPMPTRLGDWIEDRTRLIHAPTRETSDKGTNYVIPNWLLRIRPGSGNELLDLDGGLRCRIRPGQAGGTRILNPLTSRKIPDDALRAILLRRQIARPRRREHMTTMAETYWEFLKEALGYDPTRSDWLLTTLEGPLEAERRALSGVWNRFVDEFRRPASLLVRRHCPSLRDQLRLEQGPEGGRHRRSFAEQQPWAALTLLGTPEAGRKLREIDKNPANGLSVAAGHLCCVPDNGPCPKSISFAQRLARHRHDPSIDRILGGPDWEDRRIRSLLMEAHATDGGELISHMRDGPKVVRRQIERAIRVLYRLNADEDIHFDTAHNAAALLIRMMVRDRFIDTDTLDPAAVAGALIALSVDTLAAFVTRLDTSLPARTPLQYLMIGRSLDTGIDAFVHFVGSTRKPKLTVRQLIRLSQYSTPRQTHLSTASEPHIPVDRHVIPAVFDACRQLTFEGITLVPLTSVASVEQEGRLMKNCLARNKRYGQELVLARIALVSIRIAGGPRATLELKPDERRREGKLFVENWSVGEFRGPRNAAPSKVCRHIAKHLVAILQSRCPIRIPKSEQRRRVQVSTSLHPSRAINRDLAVAEQRWQEVYLRVLPRRFSRVTPGELIDSYFRHREAQD